MTLNLHGRIFDVALVDLEPISLLPLWRSISVSLANPSVLPKEFIDYLREDSMKVFQKEFPDRTEINDDFDDICLVVDTDDYGNLQRVKINEWICDEYGDGTYGNGIPCKLTEEEKHLLDV